MEFQKAHWAKYTQDVEEQAVHILNQNTNTVEDLHEKLCNVIINSAKKWIPKGKITKYRSFWSKEFSTLKKERNKARRKAERSKQSHDVQEWRRKAALVKKEIITAKRKAFQEFVEKMDYRKDGGKAYKFVNNMRATNNTKTEPITYMGRTYTSHKSLATLFNKFYSNRHKIPKEAKRQQKCI